MKKECASLHSNKMQITKREQVYKYKDPLNKTK